LAATEADDAFSQGALEINEDDPDTLYFIARSLRDMKRRKEAEDVLRALFRTANGSYAVYHNAALLAESMDNLGLAVLLYERALALNDDDLDTNVAYADCLSKMPERAVQADAIFEQLLHDEHTASNPKVISMHTDHLMRQDRAEEARMSLDHLAAVAHDSLIGARLYLNDLTNYYEELGVSKDEYAEKLEEFARSLDKLRQEATLGKIRQADVGTLYAHIATRLADLDRSEEATENYLLALPLGVTDPVALSNFATDLRQRYSQPDLALSLWRIAVQKRPGSESIWRQLISALAFGESLSPDILYALVSTPPGAERLSMLNEALGPVEKDLTEIFRELQAVLSAHESIVPGASVSKVVPIEAEEVGEVEETETGKVVTMRRKKAI
jgi:tetratricopeptide (TPR) repeat protein